MGWTKTALFERHRDTCAFRPKQRPRTSVAGRAVINARRDAQQAEFPAMTVTAHDGKQKKVQATLHEKYLGHIDSADGDTEADMTARMNKSTAEFWKSYHLWKHPIIRRRDKFRMFRQFLMMLVYAGAQTWILTPARCSNLNGWAADKIAVITGRTTHEEAEKRTVDVVRLLRFFRLRMIGDVLRSH